MISGIIPRNDKLDDKVRKLMLLSKNLCESYNFHFIDNSNISKINHLNTNGLHLNFKGTFVLGNNLVDAIKL